ncbi:MAG: hypothetical protein QMD22_09495, partial [archaeon]|nr:hypothetical protein [archaeon]
MGEQKAKATANADLTSNEKRVLLALDSEKDRTWDPRNLSEKTGINEDAVMQSAFMLAQKGLCEIKEEKKVYYRLTEEGKYYKEKGLPERRALDFLREKKSVSFDDFRNEFPAEVNISTTWLLRKGYARIEEKEDGKVLTPTGNTSWLPPEVPKDRYPNVDVHEEIVRIIPIEREIEESELRYRFNERFPEIKDRSLRYSSAEKYPSVDDLVRKRKWLEEDPRGEWKIAITEAGHEVVSHGISVEEELTQLTPELIRTGSWKGRKFKRYDVNLPSKEEFPAKIHPYQRILDRMRRIFTEMGFEEIKGELIQSAFWNFDALFVPQDHPAREMQDTFYLGVRKPLDVSEDVIRNVKEMHEHGGPLNSTGWGGEWRRG